MFKKIISLIKEKQYSSVLEELHSLSESEDPEVSAKAYYLLGYINTRPDYCNGNEYQARRYLRYALNSGYAFPSVYTLYARVEKDPNVASNYLSKGLERFPANADILHAQFDISLDKESVIQTIQTLGVTDPLLLGKVVSHLASTDQWARIERFLFRIKNNNTLSEYEQNYLDLIEAFTLLFNETPDFDKARDLLKKVIAEDIDNQFAYAHYLGIIYAFLNLGQTERAVEYFDRLPINNSIHDLYDGPQPLGIWLVLESFYKTIFNSLLTLFSRDAARKQTANVLYSLYLYYPSEIYGTYRYKKSDATILSRYLKTGFNENVAVALYNMRCHFKQYKEAYDVLWLYLKEYKNPEESDLYFSVLLDEATTEDICAIADQTVVYLQEPDYSIKIFDSFILEDLVKNLFEEKDFTRIRSVAQYVSDERIINSSCAFYCAFAFADAKSPRAIPLYEGLVHKEPQNHSAINNLGVRYENEGDLHHALECYEKAISLDPKEEIYQRNVTRVRDLIFEQTAEEISEIQNSISMDSLESIGYTTTFAERFLQSKIMKCMTSFCEI